MEALLIRSPAMTLTILLVTVTSLSIGAESYRGMVGGRKEIENVKGNEEVQELGKFSVDEYNQRLKLKKEEEEGLEFVEVVGAESQVVAGIKYYLKISAIQNGSPRMFDSEVVVKPWLRCKKLLNFAPTSQ
ncbi:cysteine proteinase inhibitor B-like [Arachis stenosperma]|uniref:cysteine proteinase inhibitor B-like n=1 Tax=Arachis stenosperma TaxID=217475 RepID=UPI0025ACEB67|nr:cysteine proteinase inhibitor B-like [Arachis stenosperma]